MRPPTGSAERLPKLRWMHGCDSQVEGRVAPDSFVGARHFVEGAVHLCNLHHVVLVVLCRQLLPERI